MFTGEFVLSLNFKKGIARKTTEILLVLKNVLPFGMLNLLVYLHWGDVVIHGGDRWSGSTEWEIKANA